MATPTVPASTVAPDKTRKARTSKVPADEGKADKFKRLASSRTSEALSTIKGIGNLANKASYDYEDAQVTRILAALRMEVNALEDAFKGSKPNAGFSL